MAHTSKALQSIPHPVHYLTGGEATPADESLVKWSGDKTKAIPVVGDVVTGNWFGEGVVTGYAVEYNWLYILVRLTVPRVGIVNGHPAGKIVYVAGIDLT